MSNLHGDILLQIFSLLSQSTLFNIIQVSKQWNSVAIPIIWHRPRFQKDNLSVYAPTLKIYGEFVRDVKFNGLYRWVKDDVQLLINMCSNITSVEVEYSEFMTREVTTLCEHLSEQLRCFSIVDNGRFGRKTGILRLAPYIATLGKLKRLKLWHMKDFDDVACEIIVSGCQLLEELDLSFVQITNVEIYIIARYLPTLCKLSLHRCCGVTDTSIFAIAEAYQWLTFLNISYAKITDAGLFALASAQCRETVTFLDLEGCHNITGTGLRQIVMQFVRLLHLVICHCTSLTEDVFDEPHWKCTKLTELDISGLDIGSSALVWISNMTSLMMLYIRGGLRGVVSEQAFLSLANLRNLHTLDLYCNEFVDDNLAKKIAKKFSVTHLQLRFTNVSQECVHKLKREYPKLCLDAL
jgi:F-box-like/Leucine Rich repeat